MSDVYFVMRGLARVSSVFALAWAAGWCVNALTGGRFMVWLEAPSNPVGFAFVMALFGAFGLAALFFVIMALYSIGGGGESEDDDVP